MGERETRADAWAALRGEGFVFDTDRMIVEVRRAMDRALSALRCQCCRGLPKCEVKALRPSGGGWEVRMDADRHHWLRVQRERRVNTTESRHDDAGYLCPFCWNRLQQEGFDHGD